MRESVSKFIELVGTSQASWEISADNAVEMASRSLENISAAEITRLDLTVEAGQIVDYRARVKLAFKIR